VFVADETRLGRKVVVKVALARADAGNQRRAIRREGALAAPLQQANIVPVLSVGESPT
jgi:hypothetical protein